MDLKIKNINLIWTEKELTESHAMMVQNLGQERSAQFSPENSLNVVPVNRTQ